MSIHRLFIALMLTFAAQNAFAAEEAPENWDSDAGRVAPGLVAASWIGTPVSLDAVKGNTVVLAFWNLDVPWC